jgi:ElaB/YqjD/DUF883 family membrane-anchored ribosome-binding protein
MNNEASINREKLLQDFKIIVADAEELLRATASVAGEKAAVARERIEDSLHRAKVKLAEAEDVVLNSTRQAARVTDEYVREYPWRAVGIAAGVGLFLGLLIGRR